MERLTKGLVDLSLENLDSYHEEENLEGPSDGMSPNNGTSEKIQNETAGGSGSSSPDSTPGVTTDEDSMDCHQGGSYCPYKGNDDNIVEVEQQMEILTSGNVSSAASSEGCAVYADDCRINKQITERRLPNAVLPLLRYCQYESSESSSRYKVIN